MVQTPVSTPAEPDLEYRSGAEFAHSLLRLLLAVRYRKNLVAIVMAAAVLLGGLYYATAPRRYSAKAALLITQTTPDRLDASVTNEESLRQNTMPTFENIVRSAAVLERALKSLPASDRVDLAGQPQECWIAKLQANLYAKAIRSTSVLEISYRSKDPQVAVNVVQSVVQSYRDLMDSLHRGTTGEIVRMLTQEREKIGEQFNRKQDELLAVRRHFGDMGVHVDEKTPHPLLQRVSEINGAMIATQKKRAEQEAMLASLRAAAANGEDLGEYLMSVGDTVGREMLLSCLGLGTRDAYTQAGLEQTLLADRAELQTLQQNLGPNHPSVVTLVEKIRLTERYLGSAQERIGQRLVELRKSRIGPWLVQMVEQKLDESRKEESILRRCFEEARADAISVIGDLAKIEMLDHEVKRLGETYDELYKQVYALSRKQNGQEVRVTITEPPVINSKPVSPSLSTIALLTVLGGLATSLGLVTLLDALDDRFRSIEEMQGRLGLPLLTMVHQLQAPEKVGLQALVTHAMPTSAASESFRTLRTALTLTHANARQLVVTSAEPGDGKTTTLANLAVCYAQAGKRTLLIDADLRRPGLTGLMNMRGVNGLSEVLRSEQDIGQMAAAHLRPLGAEGLDMLPSGPRPTDPAELLGSLRFSQLLAWAEANYDQILIDSPPTLATTDTAIIGRLVDGVILVVQPAKNRRRLVTRVVERLALMKIPVLGLVVNRTGSDDEHGYYGYHEYGYGYGYNYGEKGAYGHEETTATPEEADEEECVPFADDRRCAGDQDDQLPGLVVPRRVA